MGWRARGGFNGVSNGTTCQWKWVPSGGGGNGIGTGGSGFGGGGGSGPGNRGDGLTPVIFNPPVNVSGTVENYSCGSVYEDGQNEAQRAFFDNGGGNGGRGSTITVTWGDDDGEETFIRTNLQGSFQFSSITPCVAPGGGNGGPPP